MELENLLQPVRVLGGILVSMRAGRGRGKSLLGFLQQAAIE